ncbi:ribosomal protein L7/L12 [Streptomyces sp. NBC_01304]|uniref:ribosomal protein L7/L12 n=1 Tax=Streptomyces sp. NBC_01304 TaxID=2903818 RepID=UPI002E155668|nr:ribosomal protein L7/L12 [Streptomyces sp. NBC_01304]
MEFAVYLMLLALVVMYGFLETKIKQTHRTMARIEGKVDHILGHLGIDMPVDGFDASPDGPYSEVIALAQAGKKIPAIKLYRELTGAGLKDAKDAVERMVP